MFFLDENERRPCCDPDPDPPRTSGCLFVDFVPVPTPFVLDPVSLLRFVCDSMTGDARERSRFDPECVRFGAMVVDSCVLCVVCLSVVRMDLRA